MKILTTIKDLIKSANQTNNVSDLIDLNLKISGYLLYLCEEETQAHKDYLDAYNARKHFEADFIMKSDLTVGKATSQAVVNSQALKQEETTTEIIYNRIKAFRFQANEFVSVLTQKIANLRRESELSKMQS